MYHYYSYYCYYHYYKLNYYTTSTTTTTTTTITTTTTTSSTISTTNATTEPLSYGKQYLRNLTPTGASLTITKKKSFEQLTSFDRYDDVRRARFNPSHFAEMSEAHHVIVLSAISHHLDRLPRRTVQYGIGNRFTTWICGGPSRVQVCMYVCMYVNVDMNRSWIACATWWGNRTLSMSPYAAASAAVR